MPCLILIYAVYKVRLSSGITGYNPEIMFDRFDSRGTGSPLITRLPVEFCVVMWSAVVQACSETYESIDRLVSICHNTGTKV